MSALEDRRLQRLKLTDDHIGRSLRDSEASGELKAAPSWGKPLDFGDGYDETPAELRMPFKVLKDAGVVPHEVTLMAEAAGLRKELAAATDPALQDVLRQRMAAIEQALSLRMERLRATGSL
jgi:Domain of unknown function (DUF1992)